MGDDKIFNTWLVALALFVFMMTLFDVHYVMPNYLPKTFQYDGKIYSSTTPVIFKYIVSFLKIILGIPLILLHLGSSNLAFGTSNLGTAASSALVFYTLLIPYVVMLTFFIPGQTGVPPAYRLFQALITNTGIRKLARSRSGADHADNLSTLMQANQHPRSDKYQALLEAEELENIAQFISQDIGRLGAINHAHEALLIARTNAKIGSATKEADILLTGVKEAKLSLNRAQSTASSFSAMKASALAQKFAMRDKSKQSTSATAAEAQRIQAQVFRS